MFGHCHQDDFCLTEAMGNRREGCPAQGERVRMGFQRSMHLPRGAGGLQTDSLFSWTSAQYPQLCVSFCVRCQAYGDKRNPAMIFTAWSGDSIHMISTQCGSGVQERSPFQGPAQGMGPGLTHVLKSQVLGENQGHAVATVTAVQAWVSSDF